MNQKNSESGLSVEIVEPSGLTALETEQVLALSAKHIGLVHAFREFGRAYQGGLDAMRLALQALRSAELYPKEQRLLLRSFGYSKQRIWEFQRIVNDTDQNFAKFIGGEIGFRLALESARRGDAPGKVVVEKPKELVAWADRMCLEIPSSALKRRFRIDRIVGAYRVSLVVRVSRAGMKGAVKPKNVKNKTKK
jgi:hypothetical protein